MADELQPGAPTPAPDAPVDASAPIDYVAPPEAGQGTVDLRDPAPQGIDLRDTTKPAVTEKTADSRSDKAHYGWPGGKSPGKETIQNAILDGNENEIRDRMATDSNAQFNDNKVSVVKGFVSKFGDVDPNVTNDYLKGMLKAQPVYNRDT